MPVSLIRLFFDSWKLCPVNQNALHEMCIRDRSDNLKEEKQRELENADAMLLMALDKYDTVLYDFCTDDDVVNLVEQINESEDVLDVNSNRLRRELSHVCNRNDGVEGITLVTERGKIFFYDRSAASFVTSTWADTVKVPDVQKGVDYQGGSCLLYTSRGMKQYRKELWTFKKRECRNE